MNALNQVIIEGNVVRQPEKSTNKNGTAYSIISIGVNRKYKNKKGDFVDDVSFFDILAYGATATACEKWCLKGRGIRVVGRLKQSIWQNESGKKQSKIQILAEHIEFKPMFKKNSNEKDEEPSDETDESKKKKIKMLAEAAQATQSDLDNEDDEEEVVF